MCAKVDKPDIEIPRNDPKLADEQLALASRIDEETRRRRLAAFGETIATGSRGLLTEATTTKSIATGGFA